MIKDKTKHTILYNIQNTLINYYEEKTTKLIQENKLTPDQLKQSIANFEATLITPEKLKITATNTDNYLDINQNIKKFNKIKTKPISNK